MPRPAPFLLHQRRARAAGEKQGWTQGPGECVRFTEMKVKFPTRGWGGPPGDSVLRWHRQESGAAFQGHVLMGGVEKLGATRAFRQLLPEFSISRDAEVQFEGTGQKDRLRASIAHSVLRKQDWPQRAGRWPASQQHPGLSKRCAVRPAAAPEASGGRLGGGCIFCGGYHKTPQPWWFKTMKKGQNVKRKKKVNLLSSLMSFRWFLSACFEEAQQGFPVGKHTYPRAPPFIMGGSVLSWRRTQQG